MFTEELRKKCQIVNQFEKTLRSNPQDLNVIDGGTHLEVYYQDKGMESSSIIFHVTRLELMGEKFKGEVAAGDCEPSVFTSFETLVGAINATIERVWVAMMPAYYLAEKLMVVSQMDMCGDNIDKILHNVPSPNPEYTS